MFSLLNAWRNKAFVLYHCMPLHKSCRNTFTAIKGSCSGGGDLLVVAVYQCTIINVMVSLGKLKLFCIARYTVHTVLILLETQPLLMELVQILSHPGFESDSGAAGI